MRISLRGSLRILKIATPNLVSLALNRVQGSQLQKKTDCVITMFKCKIEQQLTQNLRQKGVRMKVPSAKLSFCLSYHLASICPCEKSALSAETALCPVTFIDVISQNRVMLGQDGTTNFCPYKKRDIEETSPCWDRHRIDGTANKTCRTAPELGKAHRTAVNKKLTRTPSKSQVWW